MAAVTVCSDFGAQESKICLFPSVPHLFAMKMMGLDAMIFIFLKAEF